MFNQTIRCLNPKFSTRKSLSFSLLLLIPVSVQFAHSLNAKALVRPSLAQAARDKSVPGALATGLVVTDARPELSRAPYPVATAPGTDPPAARLVHRSRAIRGKTVAQSPQDATILAPGKPVERALSGGQKHVYQLLLTEGQYANVLVEQHSVDVVGHLFGADGTLIADVDSERTAQGSERIELVAGGAGSYKLEITPSLPKADTGRYSIHLSEVREATADEKLLHEARKQYYESLRLNDASKSDKAIEFAIHALATREKILGSGHRDVAASLLLLGNSYWGKGDHTRAEEALQRAMDATAKISGTETLDYADVLHALARVRFSKGDHEQAEQLNLRALSIREKTAGLESAAAASSLQNLALLYRTTNDLPKAEQLYLRALAIREKLLGPDHVEVSALLNNLGLLYYGAGDYNSAEPILRRSLTIREKQLGPIHRLVGAALNNLGLVAWKSGDYEKAEAYHRRAMSVYEKANGPESYGVGSSFHNLGIIYKEAGQNYAKAEEHYQRALAIWEKIFGENDASIANALTSLAILYEAMGDYDRALKFHLRALAIYERVLGPNNHYTVLSLRGLADVYAIKGDIDRSMEYQRRISAIEEKIIPLNLTIGSERQKIAYFTQLQKPDRVISFHVRLARDDGAARDLAATKVLQRKGRVLDALSESRSALRRRFNVQDQALLDSLGDLNSRLAKLVLSAPQRMSPEEHRNQISALEGEREKLEAEISRRSAGFYEGSQPVTLATVRAAIPSDAALVEFAAYRPVDLKATDDKKVYGEPRYVAYVIRHQGEVRWTELGAAKEIDSAVDSLRQALRDPRRKDAQQLARAVDEKLMRPVRAIVGDATHLLVSPDGELNLIPFEALVDEQEHYLVERYAVTYLTSGRDLLRMQVARAGGSKPTVFANPSFGESVTEQIAKAVAKPTVFGGRRRSVTNARDLSETYFAPLNGTAQEARTIQTLFPEANLLTGTRATESALKQIAAPRLLHLATHGFFLSEPGAVTTGSVAQVTTRGINPKAQSEPGAVATGSVTPVITRGINANARIENPLLRSGLALAGANLRGGAASDDGILTALEASGLNLWGTKLVVLSACDTGLGEVRNGEGVYGLRRAFVLAGAESMIMSLWPASDYATRKLMTDYYRNLKQGMGRGAALRQVQLDMLRRNRQLHPFYWANFIQSGDWANLDGKR